MLDEICGEIHNYFLLPGGIHNGEYSISGGSMEPLDFLIPGQYFRVVGSRLNDGVYRYPESNMTDEEFEALPYGSEGLWRKLMHASRSCGALEEILAETKSKRYTRSRLDRMVMCAFLGLTAQMLTEKAPYVRVLGFRGKGTDALKLARKTGDFPHIGEKTGHAYEILERRCDDLYGLFRAEFPEKAGMTQRRRVCIHTSAKAD